MQALCACVGGGAFAQSQAKTEYEAAASNFIYELLYCYGYITIIVGRMPDVGTPQARQQALKAYKASAESTLQIAILTSQQIGLSDKAIVARTQLVMDDLRKQMNNHITNFAVLIVKYYEPCKAIVEKPMDRLRELVAREDRRAGEQE